MEPDGNHLVKAFSLAEKAHADQTRKFSGAPYFEHPKAVVAMLRCWGVSDPILLSAALCHDVLEDTDISYEELRDALGEAIASMARALSYGEKRHPELPKPATKDAYLDGIACAASDGVRLVKCADRICNARDFAAAGKIAKAREYLLKAEAIFRKVAGTPLGNAAQRDFEALLKELGGAESKRME